MRRMLVAAAVIAALTSGCSAAHSAQTPEQQWIAAVKSAGWLAIGNDYGTMYDRAGMFCSMKPAQARLLLSLTLSDHSHSAAKMRQEHIPRAHAVEVYLSATHRWACH